MRYVTYALALLALAVGFRFSAAPFGVVAQGPVPTLVPPTLVPTIDPAAVEDVLPSESALARIQSTGRLRVGMLYNQAPFGELNIRGEQTGFDADLARSIAETWGVELDLMQVTRQTAVDLIRSGELDLLVAAQIHHRSLDALVEFSQTYFVGSKVMMVRADDGAATLADMANRRIGVVIASDDEAAAALWSQRSGITANLQTYLTLDRAFVALLTSDVDGIISSRYRLIRMATQPDQVRILDQAVATEPYAVVMRRQDVNLRNLVNRTLQYLAQSGRLEQIQQQHFSSVSYNPDLTPQWQNLGDEAPKPDQFTTDIPYPAQPVLPRLLNERVIRVAGISNLPEDAPESARRLALLNRSIVEKMVERWDARIEFLPDSAANALELVANGSADLAVGVEADWNWADRVDFTAPYLLHGQRLLVRVNSEIESFAELRGGKWVAIATNEPEMEARAVELATSVNARIEVYYPREQDIAFAILVENNADVAFGDSLKLIPHVQANPEDLRLTDRWYSRRYVGLAVPRNDLDFRLLVEYTLQELSQDGTLQTLLQPVMLPQDMLHVPVWPGPSSYFGLTLGG